MRAWRRRLVVLVVVFAFGGVACSKDPAARPARDTSPASTADAAPRVPPSAGPCASDADCMVWLDACDCTCHPVAGNPPVVANECSGGAPRNCGVASPCAALKPSCDPATKTCRAAR